MASSQNSPVLVQHASLPHTLSPEVTVVSIPTFNTQPPSQLSPLPEPAAEPPLLTSTPRHTESEPATSTPTPVSEMPDTPMHDTPPPTSEPVSEPNRQEESGAEADPLSQPAETAGSDPLVPVDEPNPPPPSELPNEDLQIPPPPPPIVEELTDVPVWVTWEDDLSTPTEDEMVEISSRESRGAELNALDVPSVEKRIYQDVDDPDQRPVKKLRLSWVIKRVRGTRENPNHVRVMVSPPAKVDGNYWQIKFYPRGNKSVSLSAYIKCTRSPPRSEKVPDSTFTYFEGPPEADLSNQAAPSHTVDMAVAAEEQELPATSSETPSDSQKQQSANSSHGSVDAPEAGDREPREATPDETTPEEDWRVPAQLGVVMYNPDEPRTCTYMSTEHQFAKSNDDWGWTNFVGPWSEIHLRQHAQRTPILQNDTIAIDAYIRIFDDPSQSLWWHSSDLESQWDSKSLAGYFPMGTPSLYNSPAVAGMTAWLLLAPFRKVLQEIDAGGWRRNSEARPKPVICHLQMILFLMRSLKKERESYVDVYPAIQAVRDLGETHHDVKSFWECFRRTIELELEGNEDALRTLGAIFDTPGGPLSLPSLPVQGVCDIQQGLAQVLRVEKFKGQLPDFLPLTLARQSFDKSSREWKLRHDRVILNEELDVSEFSTDKEYARYTLYGFMVHRGERNSGKFYSVLRPNGPNTKWLAFEDGEGNKVLSYTRKRLREFEGLEGQALKDFNSTRHTAYMAMYIRTSCLGEYLTGSLEPYKLPKWLAPYLESPFFGGDEVLVEDSSIDDADSIDLEVYSDEAIIGREGLLDMYSIKQQPQHKGMFHLMTSPRSATYQSLRSRLTQELGLESSARVRLFVMSYQGMGHYMNAQMHPVCLKDLVGARKFAAQPLCLWMSILKTEEELKLFGDPDEPNVNEVAQDLAETQADDVVVVDLDTLLGHTDSAGGEPLATPDAEQASVQAAVAADMEGAINHNDQLSSEEVEPSDPDTPMQSDVPPPTAEESLTADVPHGHLFDAADHNVPAPLESPSDNEGSQQVSFEEASVLSAPEEAVIAAAIAAGSEVMDYTMNSATEAQTNAADLPTDSSEAAVYQPLQPQQPVDNVYGFIQVFDVDTQNFTVRETFFARCDDKVKDFVRQRMGCAADQEINVWRRDSVVDGLALESEDTFRDPRFINGVDLIVGEPIPEAKLRELRRQGKFSNPFELSNFLRMVGRRHPIESKTTSEALELSEFGRDYYKGHLVNGRAHGEDSVCISSSGHIYQGPLICNKKCGKGGKMTYQNGDSYEGEWDEDERHGQGTFVESRTGNKYVGGFEYGKRWGMGTTYWQVADEQADLCQICYGEEIDALFFDCGHVCSCVECARQCEICPICRRSVKSVVKMFRA